MTPREFFGLCGSNRPTAIDYLRSSISLDINYAKDLVSYYTPSGTNLLHVVSVDGDHELGLLIDAVLKCFPGENLPSSHRKSPFETALMNGHSSIMTLECMKCQIDSGHLNIAVKSKNDDVISAIIEVCTRNPLVSVQRRFNPYRSHFEQTFGTYTQLECSLCMGMYISLAHLNAKALQLFIKARHCDCELLRLDDERDVAVGMNSKFLSVLVKNAVQDRLSGWRTYTEYHPDPNVETKRDVEECVNTLTRHGADLTMFDLGCEGHRNHAPIYDIIETCPENMSIRFIDHISNLHLGSRYMCVVMGSHLISFAIQARRFRVVTHLLKMGTDISFMTVQSRSLHHFRKDLRRGVVSKGKLDTTMKINAMVHSISQDMKSGFTDLHAYAIDTLLYAYAPSSVNTSGWHRSWHTGNASMPIEHINTFHQRLTLTKLSHFQIKRNS